jgi:hypothetical protein
MELVIRGEDTSDPKDSKLLQDQMMLKKTATTVVAFGSILWNKGSRTYGSAQKDIEQSECLPDVLRSKKIRLFQNQ